MAIKQRLYPAPGQIPGLLMHCDHARFVYNIGLEQRRMWTRTKRHFAAKITTASQMHELAELRSDLDWLRAGSSHVQQAALRDLDRAFANFYAGHAKYPQFKRRSEREGSFVVRDLRVHRLNRRWATIHVPKIGHVRFKLTREWKSVLKATSARIILHNDQWRVTFITAPPPPIESASSTVVGIDRGVANTLATNDGAFIQAPSLTPAEQERFVLLQQRLQRQQRESQRRKHTLDLLATLRRRLSNRRRDWIEQTTTNLARTYGTIVLERLDTANMVRRPKPKPDPECPGAFLPNGARAKSALNRAILASCWGGFEQRLKDKAQGRVVFVPAAFTSQQCSRCGHIDARSRESQAAFTCVQCGHAQHADTNAALNIAARYQPTGSGGLGASVCHPAAAPTDLSPVLA